MLRLLAVLAQFCDLRHPDDRVTKNQGGGVMFDLFLPYVIGLALGIDPNAAQVTPEVAPLELTTDEGSGDDASTRTPEPQIPTGKYTTAVEVKPILGLTKSNWVAVRAYEGQDLLYFSHLLAWRCGLWDIRYGVNGAAADNVVPMEPCHEDTAQPNGLTDVINYSPFVTLPLDSVDSVYVELTYDDGTTDFAQFDRAEILIP